MDRAIVAFKEIHRHWDVERARSFTSTQTAEIVYLRTRRNEDRQPLHSLNAWPYDLRFFASLSAREPVTRPSWGYRKAFVSQS